MLDVLDRLLVVEDPEDHLRKVGGLVYLPATPRVGLAEGDLESTIGTRDRHPDQSLARMCAGPNPCLYSESRNTTAGLDVDHLPEDTGRPIFHV